jgi:poly(hydroxyalkanoate) depolymerase family esterase
MKIQDVPHKLRHRISNGLKWLNTKLGVGNSLISRASKGMQQARETWHKRDANDRYYFFQPRRYFGSRARQYLVHEPSANLLSKPRPLVVVLHGCNQDNRDIEYISGFNQVADQHDFLVAYPFITSYGGLRFKNCWGWWFDREIHAGSGEVEDLWQIIEEIKTNYQVDAEHIHVAGLSSGAGMAVAMMVAHAANIASGAAVAGMPYSERADAVTHLLNRTSRNKPIAKIVSAMRQELSPPLRAVPIQIIHSEQDTTVDIQSAKNLRDSWGECFDINTQHAEHSASGKQGSTSWIHNRYGNQQGRSVIETLFLTGPGHGWYGGNAGEYSYPDGPDISQMMWKFFSQHPRHN